MTETTFWLVVPWVLLGLIAALALDALSRDKGWW